MYSEEYHEGLFCLWVFSSLAKLGAAFWSSTCTISHLHDNILFLYGMFPNSPQSSARQYCYRTLRRSFLCHQPNSRPHQRCACNWFHVSSLAFPLLSLSFLIREPVSSGWTPSLVARQTSSRLASNWPESRECTRRIQPKSGYPYLQFRKTKPTPWSIIASWSTTSFQLPPLMSTFVADEVPWLIFLMASYHR